MSYITQEQKSVLLPPQPLLSLNGADCCLVTHDGNFYLQRGELTTPVAYDHIT